MIGKVLGNRYEILEKIGTGGMGDVYKAHDRKLDRVVAIKVLKREFNDDNNFIRKFKRESLAAASISHPNIVSIYDVGSEESEFDKTHYIVMEYIDGKTLKEVINEEGRLTEKRALNYCVQIAEALKVAHSKNIVHRDIKAQNIMITKDDRVKVTDFGIARVADNSTVTATNAIMGSVHYFSPEQARGAKVDNRSDIYSLGIVLYEMLTGKLPFDAENPVSVALMQVQSNMPKPSDLNKNVSKAADAIVLKMTMKDPDDRYKDVYQLIKDIKNIQLGRTSDIDYSQTMKQTMPLDDRIKDMSNESQKSVSERGKKVVRRPQNAEDFEQEDEKKETKKKETKKKKKKKSATPVVLGIITAALLFVMIAVVVPKALFNSDRGQIEQNMKVKVPDLKGVTEDEARTILKARKLEMNVSGNEENYKYKNREVLSQSPLSGDEVEEGSTVNVVINVLPESVKVPRLEGKTLEEAQDIVNELDLRIADIKYEFSEDVDSDKIISQSPEAGSDVTKDQKISIVISKGVDESKEDIPDVIGISKKAATKTLEKLGFEVKTVEQASNMVEKGEVVDYSPKENAKKGDTITIYVSSGKEDPETDDSEDEDENTTDSNKPINSSYSKDPVSTNFNVRVPDDGERHRIEVKRHIKDGKTYTIYNYHKTSSDGDISIPVEGGKGDKFEIYVDDKLVQSQNL